MLHAKVTRKPTNPPCLSQLHRQFSLAQYMYDNITEEDKQRLLFSPENGIWSGYKHPYGFKVG